MSLGWMGRLMRGFVGQAGKTLAAFIVLVAAMVTLTPALALAASPTVTSVSPNKGPLSGGTSVIISGSGFSTADPTGAVKFGGTTAPYTVDSDSQITATSPAHASGIVDVTVTNPDGTSTTSSSDWFTFVPSPTISAVSPNRGPTSGGTTVVVTGSGFSAMDPTGAVKFGATNATYTINSNTQFTATSPASSVGTYDVTVTTPGGTSSTSASDQYTYVARPIGTSQTYGSIIAYNDGSNATTNIDLSFYITGGDAPTNYAVGSATTAQGGSVSVNSSGIATYTPPVGYRNGNDSFTYTASNVGGTSAPATVTVTMGNPTITLTLPSSTGTVERVYNSLGNAVTFLGGRATYTVNSISGLPSGLTDAGGGLITGTPTVNGVYTVTVNVTDSSLGAGPYNANVTANLVVSLPPAPVASSFAISGLTYNSGSATATTFSAAPHSTESPTGYQVGASSYGGTVNVDSAGLMSYTPPVGFRGTDTFNWVATNAGGTSNVGQVFVTVDDPVFSVTLPASSGTVGVAYNTGSSTVTMSGGHVPYNNFSATGLPPGLTMDSSGVISGTPTTAGAYTVVVTTTDSSGGNGSYTSTASVGLNIAAPSIVLSPNYGALTGAQAAVAYSGETITATGGITPHAFAVTSGSLPPGMMLSSAGVITGTPTGTGTYNFTITATDSSGNSYTGAATYSITVAAPAISLSTAAPANGNVGVAYSHAFTASGGNAPYVYTVDSGALPAGLILGGNGALTGTSTQAGSFSFTVKATDATTGGTYSDTQTFSLTIGAPTISLSSTALPNATVAANYSQTITASGGTAAYTYVVSGGSLPAGMNLSGAGVLSGAPTAGGTFTFDVTATDSSTGTSAPFTGTRSYTLLVGAPTITLSPSLFTGVAAGGSVNQTITASGGVSGYTYMVTAGTLPSGVNLSTGGVLSGAPTAAGVFSFTITATDSSTGAGPYSGSQGYSWTIGSATVSVGPATIADGQIGAAYSQTFTATDGVGPYTYTVMGALPAGLNLTSAGVLSGTPTQAGTFGITITATDSATGTGAPFMGSLGYTFTIASPTFTLSPSSLSGMMIGAPFSASFTATGGAGPISYRVLSGALPAGLNLSSSGTLSGTPTAAGSFNFTIEATDSSTGTGAPFTVSHAYSVTLAAPTLTLTPSSLPAGVAGSAYSQALTTGGGAAPYSYAVVGGALPAGLTLSNGTLSGTPTASGAFTFDIKVTDCTTGSGSPFSVTNGYNFTIAAPTVTLSPSSLPNAIQSSAYSQYLTASGGVGPYAYSLTSGALPAGVTLSTGGLLSGAPTVTGSFSFTVQALDSSTGGGPTAGSQAYSLTVQSPPPTTTTPEITTPPTLPAADYGSTYTRSFAATGGTAPYRYELTGTLPAGLTFNTATGELSGLPIQAGTFAFTVTATDATGAKVTVSASLTTNAPPPPVVVAITTPPMPGPVDIDLSSLVTGFYDTIVITVPPQHGTVTINQGGSMPRSASRSAGMAAIAGPTTLTYTPNPGYTGPDSFAYVATGPGGTSAPAAISVSVTASAPAPAEDTVSTPANSPVEIAVTANDIGSVDSIAVATAPTHGTAVVNGLKVTYTPTPNYFGPDSFTYTATSVGGVSAPSTVKVTVVPLAAPTQTPQTLTVLAGRSAVLAATQGATGSPFTTVAVGTKPAYGTATVSGLEITYVPNTSYSGSDSFTYVINNPFGASTPVPVTVTVNPVPLPAPPITVEVFAGKDAVVDLTAKASGGPFTGAAVASITPTESGKATIASPAAGRYVLTFKADNAFAGTATITYTLSNAFATSAPGAIKVIVTGRPDPTKDPEVKGLIAAQSATAVRFADAQISNFNRRLEQLHNGGGAGRGFGVSVQGGNPYRTDGIEARERQRHLASLGLNDATDPASQIAPISPAYRSLAELGGSGGQAGPKRWNAWASGSADFGMRNALGSQSGFRFTTDGLTAGADYRVGPNLAIGFGLGYGRDSSRIGKLGTKSRAQGYSGGLYASFLPAEAAFIDGLIGAGTLDFDTRRHETVSGNFVTGDRDGDQIFAALTFGMERRRPTSLISPYGRIAFSRSDLNAFTEVGGGSYGLTYLDQTVRSLTGTLGLRGQFSRKVSAGLLSPRFRVEYSHDFEGGEAARISYADWMDGPVYRLAVDPTDRNQVRLELGADLTIRSGLTLGLDFDNSLSKDSNSQGLRLTIQSPF